MLLSIDCKPIRSALPKACLPILIVQVFSHRFTLIHFQGFPLFFPRSSRLPYCVFLRRGDGKQRENGPLLPGPRLGNHGAGCFGPKRCKISSGAKQSKTCCTCLGLHELTIFRHSVSKDGQFEEDSTEIESSFL